MSTSNKRQRPVAHFATRASMLRCVEMYVRNSATYPFPPSEDRKLRSVIDGVLTECGYGRAVTPREIAVDVCEYAEVLVRAVRRVKRVFGVWIPLLDDPILNEE